jgi:hypothetical protein
MLRSASIAHRIPGRIRIRIPSAKADSEFLEQARAALSTLPRVLEVSCNPLTGSILVLHVPGAELELEGAMTSQNGSTLPFVLTAAKPEVVPPRTRRRKTPRQSYLASAIAETVADLDDAVRAATGNALDLKVLLPIVAGSIGITMLRGSRRTPLWLTLLIFAFTSFTALHGEENAEAAIAEEVVPE